MRILVGQAKAIQTKLMLYRYEGTLELSAPSKPSAAFFRANRKVCDDWFSRIRQVYIS
jgi:PI-3-kinase-related kinase SMG-1